MMVALLAEKGGTGKTTLATSLAGMRAMSGYRVLLIDAGRQGSSHFWAQAHAGLPQLHVDSEALHGEALGRRLRNPGARYDDVIVDTGAGDSIEMEAVLDSAECAIAPFQPSGVDGRDNGPGRRARRPGAGGQPWSEDICADQPRPDQSPQPRRVGGEERALGLHCARGRRYQGVRQGGVRPGAHRRTDGHGPPGRSHRRPGTRWQRCTSWSS